MYSGLAPATDDVPASLSFLMLIRPMTAVGVVAVYDTLAVRPEVVSSTVAFTVWMVTRGMPVAMELNMSRAVCLAWPTDIPIAILFTADSAAASAMASSLDFAPLAKL